MNNFNDFPVYKLIEEYMLNDDSPYIIVFRRVTNNDGYYIGKFKNKEDYEKELSELDKDNKTNFDISAMRKDGYNSPIIHGL